MGKSAQELVKAAEVTAKLGGFKVPLPNQTHCAPDGRLNVVEIHSPAEWILV